MYSCFSSLPAYRMVFFPQSGLLSTSPTCSKTNLQLSQAYIILLYLNSHFMQPFVLLFDRRRSKHFPCLFGILRKCNRVHMPNILRKLLRYTFNIQPVSFGRLFPEFRYIQSMKITQKRMLHKRKDLHTQVIAVRCASQPETLSYRIPFIYHTVREFSHKIIAIIAHTAPP